MEINLAAGQRSGGGHVSRIVRTESDSYLCRQRHPAGSDRRFRAQMSGRKITPPLSAGCLPLSVMPGGLSAAYWCIS